MASKKTAFLRPDIDFSDDDDMSVGNGGARLISNKIKKTKTNVNAIKNPNEFEEEVKVAQEEDDDDDEPEVLSDDDSPVRRPNPRVSKKRKSEVGSGDKKKSKKSKRSDSDDEFLPEDGERSDEEEDEEEEEDVASEDLSDDFDSDFNPDDEEEVDTCQEEFEGPGDQEGAGDGATINLSSDGEASPEKREQRKTFDTNGKEFWDKVQELRSKGFSIQQAGNGATKSNPPAVPAKNVPKSPIRPRGGQAMSRLTAFSNLVINFDHDKRCVRKCFLMEPKQKQTLAEISNPSLLSPEFVKGSIKIVNCNFRLGDVENTREAVNMISELANIPGVSALCHALIGGVKAQVSSISQFAEHEKEGMAALKTKEFTKALECLDRALSLSSACLRLKMARGDCLAHLGRYVEGAKAASSILQQDQRNVGALFLRGFCLYHKNNIDRALSHFQQVLQINKEHERAKTLLNKAKMFKDKRDAAHRALNEKRLDDAEKYFTDALGIDPRNKGTNANLLAERAELYFSLKKFDLSVTDCEASLKLDQHCMAAMLGRAKNHIEAGEWEAAVRIMERMNTRDRHNQQGKLKAGEAAQKAGNHPEAVRLFSEAVDVDKHNQKYRHLLREAKQKLLLETRVDYYGVLGIEKTVGDSEIRKAYFKKSKEYHPDRHANDSDEVKEEFSKKFKFAKEAYEILSDIDKRKMYDSGRVKAPPGGWYQDVDKKIYETVQMRGGLRGRGVMRGMVRGGLMVRGGPVLRPQMARGQVRPVLIRGGGPQIRARPPPGKQPIMRVALRPGARPVVRGPINVRPGLRPIMRPGVRPTLMRPGVARPRGGLVRGSPNGIRPTMNGTRPRLNGISITPISQPDVVDVDNS